MSVLSGIGDFISSEPTAIISVVRAGLALAVGFGLGLTGEQVALIIVFAEAILGLINRQVVTPTAKLESQDVG